MLIFLLILLAPSTAPVGTAPVSPAPATQPVLLQEDGRLAELKRRIAWELENLALECQKAKAFVERNATYELLLAFAPEHATARKTLGHKKDRKTGEWSPPSRPRRAKAAEEEIAAPLATKRAELLTAHIDAVLLLLDSQELAPIALRRQEEALLALAPDHVVLHGRLGEVLHGEGSDKVWMLAESVRALAAFKTNTKLRDRFEATVPELTEGSQTDLEKDGALGVPFTRVLKTNRVRCVSALSEKETQKIGKLAHATYTYMDSLLVCDQKLNPGTLYLFEGKKATAEFIQLYPDLEPARRKMMKDLLCSYLSHDAANSSSKEKNERLDGALRMTIARHLAWTTGTYGKHGWIAEGVGIYVTHQMCGTRLIFTRDATEGSAASQGADPLDRMKRPKADWLALARTTMESKKSPKLGFTLGRDVNKLTREDVLVSSALASYLLEGCEPGVAMRIFKRIGHGKLGSAQVLEEELGLNPPALKRRLIRWLKEIGK
ncbi:MAG TPA: hypothetical protein EYQ25_03220 [Planctomycetes bacterium]|nr:hypothetical protein [Planctomycetota bacterium]HIL37517.1 hypothetical protein [Planctomycetota bacterium]